MPEKTTDRRIIRTNRLIRDTLTELMKEKGFEGITVNELTAKADINRGTFYLHYRDKQDLLEQSEDEIIKKITKILSAAQQLSPEETLYYNSHDEPFPFIVKLFEYIKDNSSFIKTLLGPKGDPSFQVKLKEVLRKTLLKKSHQLKKEEMMVPPDYLIAYLCSAYLGLVQHWLESGMKESPRDISLVLLRINLLGPGKASGLLSTSKS
ncbi:TetR/AcrR family transcriptional regulator [Pelotomaculum propionicicum]|uniref:TetR/AcrR family transcriptional regulator n=1 Tax=Pelotomaculum propionicicum TaxID=258475 RepID=UPI003B778608